MNDLEKQIQLVQKAIKKRPKWMRKAAHFEGTNHKREIHERRISNTVG